MKTRRILVVDDDIQATRMIKLALERTKRYEVREVNDSTRALWVAREFQPDLFLLDVCMPGTEGVELAFQIRAEDEFQRVPIVFLTSLVSEREAISDGTDTGAFHFVAKPARLQRMITCIERSLEIAKCDGQFSTQAGRS
jgi:DNA-binding response OmpR family regulator